MKIAGSGIIIKDEKILLIQRPKNTSYYPLHWALPGGRGEEGESPEETTIREVKEEVGLDFQIIQLIGETKYNGYHLHRYHGIATGKIEIQEEEINNHGRFSYEQTLKIPLAHDLGSILEKLKEKELL